MPTSTRSQTSQNFPRSHARTSLSAEPETFASASTAILPPRYRITLALPPTTYAQPLDEAHIEYVRGEEFLSDGWRRAEDEEREGDLEVRKMESRKKVVRVLEAGEDISAPVLRGRAELGTLWFTAGMKIPCICTSPF